MLKHIHFGEHKSYHTCIEDNESKSSYGVIRGLHFQKTPFAQSKLVRVVKGTVLDVAETAFIHQYIPTDKDYPPHSGTPQ